MRIGEVAREVGISVDTVRVYDRRGLLPQSVRTANGYREFPPSTVRRLRVIRSALAVGLTLRELAEFFAQRERGRRPARRCGVRPRRASSGCALSGSSWRGSNASCAGCWRRGTSVCRRPPTGCRHAFSSRCRSSSSSTPAGFLRASNQRSVPRPSVAGRECRFHEQHVRSSPSFVPSDIPGCEHSADR